MNDWKETLTRFIDGSYEIEATIHLIFYVGIVIAAVVFAIYLALH
jgi:hypothetical protein